MYYLRRYCDRSFTSARHLRCVSYTVVYSFPPRSPFNVPIVLLELFTAKEDYCVWYTDICCQSGRSRTLNRCLVFALNPSLRVLCVPPPSSWWVVVCGAEIVACDERYWSLRMRSVAPVSFLRTTHARMREFNCSSPLPAVGGMCIECLFRLFFGSVFLEVSLNRTLVLTHQRRTAHRQTCHCPRSWPTPQSRAVLYGHCLHHC